jgi:hypothetical protein
VEEHAWREEAVRSHRRRGNACAVMGDLTGWNDVACCDLSRL